MKRTLRIFLLIGMCVVLTLSTTFYALAVTANATRAFTVVLDAGHGGIDCGVVGRNTGVKESDVNLAIVKKLQTLLKDASVRTVLTRQTPAGLYGVVGKGMKRRDMERRKQIIERAAPVAVVSIHQNSFPQDTSHCGGQVFYRADHEKGRLLASAIQRSLNETNPFRQDRDIHAGDYYMLNCTDYPSVIVECGFLTNEAEEKLLLTEEYQTVVAESVMQGILSFFAVETGKRSP